MSTRRTPKQRSVPGTPGTLASPEHEDERNPSEVTDQYWIRVSRKKGTYPERTERGGKWLLYVPASSAGDEIWAKIKAAVKEGRLGDSAKVATALAAQSDIALADHFSGPFDPKTGVTQEYAKKLATYHRNRADKRVICVYTYDSEDERDVMRVREELRTLGFNAPIAYKTDQATLAHEYRVTRRGKRVSKYYV